MIRGIDHPRLAEKTSFVVMTKFLAGGSDQVESMGEGSAGHCLAFVSCRQALAFLHLGRRPPCSGGKVQTSANEQLFYLKLQRGQEIAYL